MTVDFNRGLNLNGAVDFVVFPTDRRPLNGVCELLELGTDGGVPRAVHRGVCSD